MSRTTERQQAKSLQAADAAQLIEVTLPLVLKQLTPAQVDQVQRVLDSYVVNPAVQKEYAELSRKAITQQSGPLVVRDPHKVHQAEQARQNYIHVTAAERRVRLNYAQLLAADALNPTTDNADEVAYLNKMRATLMHRGVWLRFDQKLFSPDPREPSRRIIDGRTFEAWLSLGPEGDPIPTETGRLTRQSLLGTTALGAGYYREVVQGKIATVLKRALNKVTIEIDSGVQLHQETAANRRTAAPLVVPISDKLGHADYPDEKIWNDPRAIVLRALHLNIGGNVKASAKLAILAAMLTAAAAELLAEYLRATAAGAERAVKVLTVVKNVGKVAEVVLIVHTVAIGLVRFLGAEAAVSGAGAIKAVKIPNRSPAAFYDTNYAARAAWEPTLNAATSTMDTGMAINRYTAAEEAVNAAALAESRAGMAELSARGASLEEKMEFHRRWGDKWGHAE